jgi:CTP:molybdopterin cytidylyltransferase MocA
LVPVDDPAVLEDIDTPEAYADLLRRIDAGGP